MFGEKGKNKRISNSKSKGIIPKIFKVEDSLHNIMFYIHPIFALSLCKNTSIEFVKMSQ